MVGGETTPSRFSCGHFEVFVKRLLRRDTSRESGMIVETEGHYFARKGGAKPSSALPACISS